MIDRNQRKADPILFDDLAGTKNLSYQALQQWQSLSADVFDEINASATGLAATMKAVNNFSFEAAGLPQFNIRSLYEPIETLMAAAIKVQSSGEYLEALSSGGTANFLAEQSIWPQWVNAQRDLQAQAFSTESLNRLSKLSIEWLNEQEFCASQRLSGVEPAWLDEQKALARSVREALNLDSYTNIRDVFSEFQIDLTRQKVFNLAHYLESIRDQTSRVQEVAQPSDIDALVEDGNFIKAGAAEILDQDGGLKEEVAKKLFGNKGSKWKELSKTDKTYFWAALVLGVYDITSEYLDEIPTVLKFFCVIVCGGLTFFNDANDRLDKS